MQRFPSRAGASLGLLLLGLLVTACGGGSDGMVPLAAAEDVEGTYSLSITNSDNACVFDSWEDGKMFSGVSFDVAQQGEEGTTATGSVSGVAGLALDQRLGSS